MPCCTSCKANLIIESTGRVRLVLLWNLNAICFALPTSPISRSTNEARHATNSLLGSGSDRAAELDVLHCFLTSTILFHCEVKNAPMIHGQDTMKSAPTAASEQLRECQHLAGSRNLAACRTFWTNSLLNYS